MNQPRELLSIGTFADMTRLSIKALRLYDDLEILKPVHVDPESGYRYYEAAQIRPARMIRSMREMEMPLATIRQVLAALPAQAETLVCSYLEAREMRILQLREEVRRFIQLINQEIPNMIHEVSVRKIPAQPVVSVTKRVKVDGLDLAIRSALEKMSDLLKKQSAMTSEPPFGIYHGTINERDDGPIEICVPVSRKVRGEGEVEYKQLEGGNCASVILTGKQCQFPEILGGYDAVVDWIRHNGYKMVGAPREVWCSRPDEPPRMEIQWLFE